MRWELMLDPAICSQLCLTLLHSLWLVTLLAAFAWIVDRLVGRRAVERSYAIHVAALLVSVVALPATYWIVSARGVAPSADVGATSVSIASPEPTSELVARAPMSPDSGPTTDTYPAMFVPVEAQDTRVAAAPLPMNVERAEIWTTIAPWFAGLYLAGVAIMLARVALGIWRAQRLGAGADLLRDGPLVDLLRSLTEQWSMRVVPVLARAEQIVTPKVIGLVRPTILLPASAISGLSTDELELILAHELAHVRRYDMWVNLLQRLAEAVLFFNPALWYLSRRVSLLREYCCDEAVCGTSADSKEPHLRYAQALLRAVEVAGVARDKTELASLAATGRSPSELRRRVARLFGEPMAESVRLSRTGALLAAALALLLVVGPVAWQSSAETEIPEEVAGEQTERAPAEAASAQPLRLDMNIVVARHVLLLEGKEIITWPELEDRLKALPDPTLAKPSFYITRGTRAAGDDQFAKDHIWRLHEDLKLAGHSEGSLWPRTDLRYDRIEKPEDLMPDQSLRVDGTIVDQRGEPVDGAEVVLITPVDESIYCRSYHMALVKGRVRNRLEHVTADSDAQGRFAVYPPNDVSYYVAALHPHVGFAMIDGGQFTEEGKIVLLPWAGLVSEVDSTQDGEQEASIRTTVNETDGLPQVILNQYWSDLKNEEPTNIFEFNHVPAVLNTTISRRFVGENGSSFGFPGATVSPLPGETRKLALGQLSEQQREQLERMRRDSEYVRSSFPQYIERKLLYVDAKRSPPETRVEFESAVAKLIDIPPSTAIPNLRDGTTVLARVGPELILASDVLPVANEKLSSVEGIDDASKHDILNAQEQLIQNTLPQFVGLKLLYVDAKRNLPEDAFENINQQLNKAFDEREVPRRLEALDLDSRLELERQLARWGGSLEHERRAFVEETIGRQWVFEKLRRGSYASDEELSEAEIREETERARTQGQLKEFVERLREEIPVWTVYDSPTEEKPPVPQQESPRNDSSADDASPASANQFTLHIVDPSGQPVPDAMVEIRTSPIPEASQILRGEFVSKSTYGPFAKADDDGRLVVALPKNPDRLNFSITTPGYGPYWANCHADYCSKTIPNEFTAQLEPAWTIGGIVVDEEGKPIESVEIRPGIDYKKRPGDNRQLGMGDRFKTDAQGNWNFDSVPVSMNEVWCEMTHPDFMPNRQSLTRAEFEIEQGEEPKGKVVLTWGLSVSGTVTDDSGKPVEGALVRTQFFNDIRKAETNEDGVYQLVGCEPRMTRIVATAKGRAVDMKEVRIEPGMAPVDFQMKPGGTAQIRVLDEDDAPIPKARILFQWWRGGQAYFDFNHVNQYADENGVWEWNEAPLDEFQADICRPGGMQITRQKLIARDEEYVLYPPPALVITGTVVDAETKQPIRDFHAVPGRQDANERIIWDRDEGDQSTDGEYRLVRTYGCHAHLVQIEASGYLSTVSRQIKNDEGNLTLNFELSRGKDVAATVLTPDGKPAAKAEAALGIAGSQIRVENGNFTRSTYAARQTADESGRFHFPAQGANFQVVVVHPTGYAYIKDTSDEFPETINLTAWARVEGTFRIGKQTAGNVPLRINASDLFSFGDDAPSVNFSHEVTTAPDGSFAFERVVPGRGRIGRNLVLMVGDGALEKKTSCMVRAHFPAGETTRLDLGGTGRTVIGKLQPPAGFKQKVFWNFALVTLRSDLPRPETPQSLEEGPSDPEARQQRWTEWRETDEGKAWAVAYEQYEKLRDAKPYITATVGSDGTFRIDDMPADKYTLKVRFSRESPGHLRDYRFEVPPAADSSPTDPIDLGVLSLNPTR